MWQLDTSGESWSALSGGLTPEAVSTAANRVFVGRQLAEVVPPTAMRKHDCVRSRSSLDCTYVMASGLLREEQLHMRFIADPQGKVARVQTEQVRKWLWDLRSR